MFSVQDAFLRMGNGVTYQLVGTVIYYRHGKGSGHYISYFKDHIQKQWFLGDDSRVRFIIKYPFDTSIQHCVHAFIINTGRSS